MTAAVTATMRAKRVETRAERASMRSLMRSRPKMRSRMASMAMQAMNMATVEAAKIGTNHHECIAPRTVIFEYDTPSFVPVLGC